MSQFSESIIKWYEVNKRDLPWRHSRDPYIIWISEIILQQTRVVQGYDYFVRFINRFPDIDTLAAATEDEVLKYWQGLGYYSRARNLHFAAKSMNGLFPTSYIDVLNLKGVGDYTAAAICSFAYNMPYPVVDGNVYRVLSRYLGVDVPINTSAGKKVFTALAYELLDCAPPAVYNQAIMDFGAIQCVPQSPNCSTCPLIVTCVAYKENLVTQLPIKIKNTSVKNRYLTYFIVRKNDCIYMRKRQANDIWKNLYELPLIETTDQVKLDQLTSLTAFKELFSNVSIDCLTVLQQQVKHVLSHQVLYVDLYEVTLNPTSEPLIGYIQSASSEIDQYAVPKLIHSFLEKYM